MRASRTVTGATVQGDLGWRELEERREAKTRTAVGEEARGTRGQKAG